MSLTTAQLATLKTEITGDPRGYGYAQPLAAANDTALAALLNMVRDGSAGTVPANPNAAGGVASGIITVRRNDISGAEILQAVDPTNDQQTGANAPSGLLQTYFNACCTMRSLSFVNPDGTDNAVLHNLKQCFTQNSASRTNLGTISKRSGTRAEELFGTGTTVGEQDVAYARQN